MIEFWQDKIKAFLHDPPDKALILFHKSHESKRDEILDRLNLRYDGRLDIADHIASAMQRLDIPKDYRMDDARSCNAHICFKGPLEPIFKHTLSGDLEKLEEIKGFIATWGYEKALDEYSFDPKIVKEFLDENDWKKTYFLLWRFLPEKYPRGYILPADTRIPDHSIWDHLDVTAAISSCLGNLGLFSLKIPAVQEFIAHSRKLSDLWASSHIFSSIIFEGIKSIIEEYGPDVVIYPQLRGNPMVDLAEFNGKFKLLNEGMRQKLIHRDIKGKLYVANFPNVFLAFIPALKAEDICRKVENGIKRKWKEMAEEAKKILTNAGMDVNEELWKKQIDSAVEITSAWLEFFNFDKFNDIKGRLPDDIRERQKTWLNFVEEAEKRSNYGHFYSTTYELLGIILAEKSRFWKAWEEKPITGKKCLMCGKRDALVENSLKEGYKCWDGKKGRWRDVSVSRQFKYTLKSGERLCVVCLVKRFYRDIFKKIFDLKDEHLPESESTVDIAGREFISRVKHDGEFQLLKLIDIELIYSHEWKSEDKKESSIKELEELGMRERVHKKLKEWWKVYGEPSKYYAILMMDGDRIGKMLSGETLPNFGNFLHPAFKNKIFEWEKGEDLVETKRIFTPSHHIAISRAMKDFSLHIVPKIVEKYKGFLVYAGGDDVLALFPTDKVLDAAKEIQEYFRKDFYEIDVNGGKREVMGLGNEASMSAGIVFAHYKWPLYDAIEKVREAEKDAKGKYRRNAFCIFFIKRSGEILTAGGKWNFVDDLTNVAKAIVSGKISHRFIYDFIEVSEVLKGDMLKAEVKRLLKRRREEANDEEIKEIQRKLCCLIEKYDAQGLKPKEFGNALKIIYDAYRGEER